MKVKGIGNATGKIILVGEHAVVYSQPAIALPFPAASITTYITQTKDYVTISCVYFRGKLAEAPEEIRGIQTLIYEALRYLKQESTPIHIEIDSSLPPGRGLGSSAAVSVSIVRALFDYFEVGLSEETLVDLVGCAEEIHHLNPSGLDAKTIALGLPVLFELGKEHRVIPVNLSGFMVVADTGEKGKTREAVAEVRELMNDNATFILEQMQTIGNYTRNVQDDLSDNRPDNLGKVMSALHQVLRKINVSNDTLDRLVSAALQAGALGAKLTGSGKGGCIIALCDSEAVAQRVAASLSHHGAVQTWLYSFDGR